MGRNSVQGGNLFYSVQLKDETEKGIQEIKSKLSNLETTLKIKVDSKAFDAKLQAELGKIDNLQKALNNVSMSASSVKLPTVTTGDTAKAAADIAALTRVMDTMKATMDNIAGNGGTFVIPISIRDNTAQGIAALQAKLAELSKGLGIDITMTGKAESLTNILTTINSLKTGLTEVSALINQVSQNFAKASKNTIDNNIVSSWLSVAMKDMKKDLEHLNNALQNNAITLRVNLDTSAAKTDMTNFVILAKEISKALEGEVVTSKLNAWVDVISRVNLQFKELAKTIANIDVNKLSAINNANKAIGESTSIDKNIKAFNRYGKMIQDLDYKIESIKVKMQSNTGFDNSKFEEAIKLLEDYKKKMQSILTSGDMNKIRSLVGGAEYKQQIQQANILLQQQRNLTKEEKERQKEAERTAKAREKERMIMAQIAEKQLTISELASKTSKEIFNIVTQSERVKSIFGTFKELVLEAFSMWSLKGFLQNLIQIGGELEKQKLAVSSILGDEYKANVLFNQIGSLAIKSPFGVIELTQYAKQLTAYGVQYSELYDTMKRMADISAGVGVDMSRIILAYGQIKAAKFLRGQELRQLTEANIPMVDKLADRFEKLSGKAVTAGQVMEMISKKQVSFEDVKAVLFDMTNEGGMFFKMQEVLSESVSAKYKNLGDAIDLLYKRVTESTNGFLKFPAEVLTELTKNISVVIPIFTVLAFKCGILGNIFRALGQSVNSVTAMTNKNAVSMRNRLMTMQQEEMVTNKRRLSELELARATGQASAAEMREIVFLKERISQENMLGVIEMERMFTELRLTGNMENWTIAETRNAKAMSLKLIRLGQVNKEAVQYLINMGLISKKEAQAAITAGSFSNALRGIGSAFKSLISVSNLVTIGIMAAVELFVNYLSYADKISKISDNMQRGVRGIKDGVNALWDSTFKNLNIEKASEAQLKTALDKGVQFIRDNIGDYTGILNPIFELDDKGGYKNDLKERAEEIKRAIDDIKEFANDNEGTYSRAIMAGFEAADGGNWAGSLFQDDVFKNAKDLLEYQSELIHQFSENMTKYPEAAKYAIEELKKIYGKELPELSDMTNAQQVKVLSENTQQLLDFRRLFLSQIRTTMASVPMDTQNDYRKALSNYMDDIISIYRKASKDIQNEFGDNYIFDILKNPAQWSNFQTQLKLRIDSEEDVSEEAKQMIRASLGNKELISKLQMLVDDKTAKEKKKELEEEIRTKLWIDVEVEDNSLQEALNEVQTAFSGITIDPTDTMSIGLEKSNKAIGDAQKVLDTWKDVEYLQKNSKGEWEVKSPFLTPENGEIYKKIAEEMNEAEEVVKKQTENIHNLNKLTDAEEKAAEEKKKADEKNREAEEKRLKAAEQQMKKELDMYNKRIQTYKDAYAAQNKWGELIGRNQAAIKLNNTGLYESIFKDGIYTLEKYRDSLVNLKSEITKKYSGKLTSDLQGVVNKLDTAINDIDFDIAKEKSEELPKAWKNNLDIQKKSWDIYKKYYEATGDREMAIKLAFENPAEIQKGMESYFQYIKKEAERLSGRTDLKTMFAWTDQDFANAGMIATAREAVRAYKEEVEKHRDEVVSAYQKYIVDYLEFTEKQKLIQIEADKAMEAATTEEAKKLIQARVDMLKEELVPENIVMYAGDILGKSISEINDWAKQQRDIINKAGLPIDEYAERINKLNQAVIKLLANKNEFSNIIQAFKSGGLKGLADYYVKKSESLNKEGKTKEADKAFDTAKSIMTNFVNPLEGLGAAIELITANITDAYKEIKDLAQSFGTDTSGWVTTDAIMSTLNIPGSSINKILNGNVLGGVVGLVTEPWTIWNKAHDAKLQKQIEKLEYQNKLISNMKNELTRALERSLEGRNTQVEITNEAQKKAYEQGGAYGYQLQLYKEELENVKEQMAAEKDKKDSDDNAIADYQDSINELRDQIQYYAEDLANSLYGIDLKTWAQQLGDALVEAWASGEDAADAYADTVSDIMKNLLKSVIKESIMQSALAPLRTFITTAFGEDFILDESEVAELGRLLTDSSASIEQVYKSLDKVNAMLKESGIELDWVGTSGSNLTNGIQGVTEQTADLLASYINAIRADVSLNRLSIANIELSLFPQLNGIAQSQLVQLNAIQDNTLKNAMYAEDIYDLLNSVSIGTKRLNVG